MTEGIKLDLYLRERGPVAPGKAARIATEVLAQIQAAPAGGSDHGFSGIGPGRILISPNGKVVLLDPEDELPAAVSAPAYASPEEIRGGAPDLRSSIYSVGCALFEMLTGRPPFTGEARAMLRAHLSEPAPDVSTLRPEIPPALSETLSWFLAKDPAERPQEPGEAAQALRAAMGKQGAGAPAAPAPAGAAPSGPASPIVRNVIQRQGPVAPRQAAPVRAAPAAARAPVPASAGAPPRPLRPGLPLKPGESLVRRRLGRPLNASLDAANPRPVQQPWIFTWLGLAAGILLCLILVVVNSQSSSEPEPVVLTQAEKDQSDARRAAFRKSLEDDSRVAAAELEKIQGQRVSFAERAESIAKMLDQYSHTSAGPKMAEMISKLRCDAEEAATNAAENSSPDADAGSGGASASSTPASPEPSAPAEGEGKKDKKAESSPDDIGAKAGGDDGKSEL